MRTTIKLPADVEFAVALLNATDGLTCEGAATFSIESVPQGKFNKVTKVVITLPSLGEVITIVPKERKPL